MTGEPHQTKLLTPSKSQHPRKLHNSQPRNSGSLPTKGAPCLVRCCLTCASIPGFFSQPGPVGPFLFSRGLSLFPGGHKGSKHKYLIQKGVQARRTTPVTCPKVHLSRLGGSPWALRTRRVPTPAVQRRPRAGPSGTNRAAPAPGAATRSASATWPASAARRTWPQGKRGGF